MRPGDVRKLAEAARDAAQAIAGLDSAARGELVTRMAVAVAADRDEIMRDNVEDLAGGRLAGMGGA
jgi:glutamate-5-semialdehyde dehydrogenase